MQANRRFARRFEFNPDGTFQRIFASGTRNPVGLAFNPSTKRLWAAVEEQDLIGDDLVPNTSPS
jgi:glucose/arabinose dehydrogenase